VGLVLVCSGPVAYAAFMDQPLARSTAAPSFVLICAGAILGLIAARRDRRALVRIVGGVDVLALPLAVFLFFGLAALPEAPAFAQLEKAPDFSLPNHQGNLVSLRETLSTGPVLLVFFRGHW